MKKLCLGACRRDSVFADLLCSARSGELSPGKSGGGCRMDGGVEGLGQAGFDANRRDIRIPHSKETWSEKMSLMSSRGVPLAS